MTAKFGRSSSGLRGSAMMPPTSSETAAMPLETPLDASPEAVRDALSPLRNDFSVALVCPGNAFAVGAIIRVAHSFLAKEVIVVGDGGWYEKASMGMHKYESVVRVPNVDGLKRW